RRSTGRPAIPRGRRPAAEGWGVCDSWCGDLLECLPPGQVCAVEDRWVVDQLLARSGEGQGAVFEYEGDVRHSEDEPGELLYEKDCHARGLNLLEGGEQALDHERSEPERQLVDHQQAGLGQQAPGDGQHLLLTTG